MRRFAPLLLLWCGTFTANAAPSAAVPLRDALKLSGISIQISGNARDVLNVVVQNSTDAVRSIEIPAGLICTGSDGAVAVLRAATLTIAPGSTAEALLPTIALSSESGAAQQTCTISEKTAPLLEPLLTYAATRDDLPKPTAQLVALALLEDVTFAQWQQFLAPTRAADATPPPTPAEVATAVDALGILRQLVPARAFALNADNDFKRRALRNPWTRAKATQLFGLALPEGFTPPDLGELLHTRQGDNCPICRMRQQADKSQSDL